MSTKIGLEAKLYHNTSNYTSPSWSELTNVKDLTLSLEKGDADATTRAASGWRQTISTLKDVSIEFSYQWVANDTGFDTLLDSFLNSSKIDMLVLDGPVSNSTSQGLRAWVEVFNFSREEPMDDVISYNVTLRPTIPSVANQTPYWFTGS